MPKKINNCLMGSLKALESCKVKCEAGCPQYICFPRCISNQSHERFPIKRIRKKIMTMGTFIELLLIYLQTNNYRSNPEFIEFNEILSTDLIDFISGFHNYSKSF